MNDALAPHHEQSAVPQGYAEKAMASLMQLHTELMDEKDRRVDLYRRLMEREQAVAELKSYVRALEEKLASLAPAPPRVEPSPSRATPPPLRPPLRAAPPPNPTPEVARPPPPQPMRQPPPPRPAAEPKRAFVGARASGSRYVPPEGWKTW